MDIWIIMAFIMNVDFSVDFLPPFSYSLSHAKYLDLNIIHYIQLQVQSTFIILMVALGVAVE